MGRRVLVFTYIFLFFFLIKGSMAQDTLDVLISGSPPFVMTDVSEPSGLSIDIWEEAALNNNFLFRYHNEPDTESAINSIEAGRFDVLVGPISILSERADRVRFTQPYFVSSISLVSKVETPSVWDRIKPFFSKTFFIAVLVLLFILGIVGTLIWLAERKKSPEEFPPDVLRGIGNGIWFALVTMTTVGYGDRAPKTLAGRIVAGGWMIIALITTTSLVAGIASTLTVSGLSSTSIRNADDLAGEIVAVPHSSPSVEFVNQYGGKVVEVENIREAFEKLNNGAVKVIVYDKPQLEYFMETNKDLSRGLKIANAEYLPQGYGFATSLESQYFTGINVGLLELHESGVVRELVNDWLKEEEE
ncbi:transporter substrate-binding domain-containing protein [Membranihabitans maritimus]|uniref:transporter substrate-binding domain-containing protein n=1 Tax=Membranihabitans maritimus TaxID=2904244 RepID=UPI001F31C948|nr:transporter substrate-binding domain-containing protein [Membranihabitans maritimus]